MTSQEALSSQATETSSLGRIRTEIKDGLEHTLTRAAQLCIHASCFLTRALSLYKPEVHTWIRTPLIYSSSQYRLIKPLLSAFDHCSSL